MQKLESLQGPFPFSAGARGRPFVPRAASGPEPREDFLGLWVVPPRGQRRGLQAKRVPAAELLQQGDVPPPGGVPAHVSLTIIAPRRHLLEETDALGVPAVHGGVEDVLIHPAAVLDAELEHLEVALPRRRLCGLRVPLAPNHEPQPFQGLQRAPPRRKGARVIVPHRSPVLRVQRPFLVQDLACGLERVEVTGLRLLKDPLAYAKYVHVGKHVLQDRIPRSTVAVPILGWDGNPHARLSPGFVRGPFLYFLCEPPRESLRQLGSLGGRKAGPQAPPGVLRSWPGRSGSRGPRFLLAWGRGLQSARRFFSKSPRQPLLLRRGVPSRSSIVVAAAFLIHGGSLPRALGPPGPGNKRRRRVQVQPHEVEVTSLHPLELRLGQQVSAVMENRPQRVGKRVDFVPSLPSLLLLLKLSCPGRLLRLKPLPVRVGLPHTPGLARRSVLLPLLLQRAKKIGLLALEVIPTQQALAQVSLKLVH
mmetsp:Transcript_9259/g.32006  ORF Transcript_9259/g.32006 Transcript_9259/m.32006 type:complete len:476 (-) Transcript_9259:53-1480(-)